MEVCVYNYNLKTYSRLTLPSRTLKELREAVARQFWVNSDDVLVYKLTVPFEEGEVGAGAVQLSSDVNNTTEELPVNLGVAYPVTKIEVLGKYGNRPLTKMEVHLLMQSHYYSWPMEDFRQGVSIIWKFISALPTTSFFHNHKGWLVDGEFSTGKGGHSIFLKVFSELGEPRLAKVARSHLEWVVSQNVHNVRPTSHVLEIEAALECHENYYLIMRPYHSTARELATAFRQSKAKHIAATVHRLKEHILDALQSLHEANYCYGPDLKLDNVLVDVDGSFVLCDFEHAVPRTTGRLAGDEANLERLVAEFEKAAA